MVTTSDSTAGRSTHQRLDTHLIAGQSMPAGGDRVLERPDPATGAHGSLIVVASDAEVDAAISAACDAQVSWRRTPPAERAGSLRAAAARIRAAADSLGDALTASTGRLLEEARQSARVAADLLDEASVSGLLHGGRALAGDPLAMDVVCREPRGVVAVLTPWNDPFPAAAGLLAAALVTGNTIVHKPSERSAVPGWVLAERIASCLPAGVLNVVNGDGSTGARVVADPRVQLVAHVGSTATGRRIGAVVGARGGRALLENGGKDPILVDRDVDPGWAAEQIAVGAFTNTGQLCTSVERVYLHEAVADAVLEGLVDRARAMRVGPPTDPSTELGPMVDERQLAVVEEHVDKAVAAGARCLVGGQQLDRPGCYYPPTVLDGCTDDMAVMAEETFGPVAAVARVPDFAEGVRRAASGAYGLAATVLTPRLDHALTAAEELDVGTVKVNAVFGGAPGGSADPRRDSGSGRGFGPALLDELTVLKAVHLQSAPPVGR